MKNYKVDWSRGSIIVTSIVGCVIVLVIVLLMLDNASMTLAKRIVGSILIITLFISVSMVPTQIDIGNGEVIVERVMGKKRFPLTDVKECGLAYEPIPLKLCGTGGFCGSLGWYKSSGLGVYFSYVMNRNEAFYVILETGRTYMLSCENPDKVIEMIKTAKR